MIEAIRKRWPAFVLTLVALIAYWQTLKMYFWQDDYTIYYVASENKLFDYPYQVNTLFVKIASLFFGLNPEPYFVLAIILFVVSVFCVKFFVYTITSDSLVSFLAAAVFASGFIGQGAMKMFLGTGIVALPALSLFLLSLTCLIKYLKFSRKSWLTLSLICFFLTLEIAPHRHATALIAILGVIALFLRRKRIKSLVLIGSPFAFLAYLELFVHPTKLIYSYPTGVMGNFSASLLQNLKLSFIGNFFASFWNSIFPSLYLDRLTGVPALLGVLLTMLTLYLIFSNKLKYGFAAEVLLITTCASLLTFFISKPDTIFESDHRYLMTISYASAIIPIILVGKKGKKSLAILFSAILMSLHLCAGITTQNEFVRDYSSHAKNIFSQLRDYVPEDTPDKVVIHLEATTKKLNLLAGDAFRVGTLPSEAALAVQLGVPIERVIISDRISELPDILKRNPDVRPENIYTFIYDGAKLMDTSPELRTLIATHPQIVLAPNIWQIQNKSYIYRPESRVSTLWPMTLRLNISNAATLKSNLKIAWEYDTSGHPLDEKEEQITVSSGQNLVSVGIPGGGRYLKEIIITPDKNIKDFSIINATLIYED